jgi:hypothetical protein
MIVGEGWSTIRHTEAVVNCSGGAAAAIRSSLVRCIVR